MLFFKYFVYFSFVPVIIIYLFYWHIAISSLPIFTLTQFFRAQTVIKNISLHVVLCMLSKWLDRPWKYTIWAKYCVNLPIHMFFEHSFLGFLLVLITSTLLGRLSTIFWSMDVCSFSLYRVSEGSEWSLSAEKFKLIPIKTIPVVCTIVLVIMHIFYFWLYGTT